MQPTAPPLPRRRAFAALPLAWAALILVLTLTPAKSMPTVPPWELISFDSAAHAFVFLVLAALSYFSSIRQQRYVWRQRHAFSIVLVEGILLGALIEFLQITMDLGRHGEWSDVISDGIGTVTGLLLARALRRWWA
ncbi:VanZ family protein [Hymenobacter cellulosilyticus]|uniref:VanZ family protein n=1 Tax=Hymenobacter cellulosilyticus TaxID=2932248 RepID=A0A8T9QA10_9BACT|nr:VanZ family protein [Hymenobacter cellulosilyticus]UOQ72650.1 VanZ family protein [Hymenobacter cellulosilyticus]